MTKKQKNILLSAIISMVATGFIALLDHLIPSSRQAADSHGWGFYLILCAVAFFISLDSLLKNETVNPRYTFIRSVIFTALFLFLAISHFSTHETTRDWVFAIVFTIAIPFEIRKAVDSYRNWKNKSE